MKTLVSCYDFFGDSEQVCIADGDKEKGEYTEYFDIGWNRLRKGATFELAELF